MAAKQDVQPGTLALMILRTLEVLGSLHGYGIARRIEETSKQTDSSSTTAPSTPLCSSWSRRGLSRLSGAGPKTTAGPSTTRSRPPGRNSLAQEAREWHRTADLIAAFLAPREEAP